MSKKVVDKEKQKKGKVIPLPTQPSNIEGADPEEVVRLRKQVLMAREGEKERYKKLPDEDQKLSSSVILRALNAKEDGDARLYRNLHKDRLCFDHAAGLWYRWKEHFWELDKIKQGTAMIDAVIEAYGKEANRQAAESVRASKAGESDGRERHEKIEKDLKDRIAQLHHKYRKGNVLHLAAVGEGSLGITGEEWDLDPWLLGCPNGTIDLESGKFMDGRQADFMKTISPTKWKGIDSPAPGWAKFLIEIFDDDAELVAYVQRLFGYGLSGLTTEHVLPILWGQGRNGKGTLLETLAHVLGELVGPVQAEMLLDQGRARSSSGPSADLMSLRGRRIAWGSETDEGRRLNAGRVKWLTGGDSITARPPFGKREITFKPSHTLFLLTNHKPRIAGDEYALWKRLHLIPFALSFVPEPKEPNERLADPDLPRKLESEAPGILAWLVRGCLEWQKQGLNPPEAVKAATAEYQSEEDILGHFLEERCDLTPSGSAQASALHEAYKTWCEKAGHFALGQTNFGKRLTKRFHKVKINGVMQYQGLRLKPFSQDENDICDPADF